MSPLLGCHSRRSDWKVLNGNGQPGVTANETALAIASGLMQTAWARVLS